MLPGFLVGLLRADADQFLERIAHLHVVDPPRRQVQRREALHDLEQAVLGVHAGDLLAEPERVHDLHDVLGEVADVGVEVLGQQVRVGQQLVEVHLGGVVERQTRRPLELLATDGGDLSFGLLGGGEDGLFGGC